MKKSGIFLYTAFCCAKGDGSFWQISANGDGSFWQ